MCSRQDGMHTRRHNPGLAQLDVGVHFFEPLRSRSSWWFSIDHTVMMGDLLNSVSNDVYSIRERLHEQIKIKHFVFIKTHLVALVSNVFK